MKWRYFRVFDSFILRTDGSITQSRLDKDWVNTPHGVSYMISSGDFTLKKMIKDEAFTELTEKEIFLEML